MTLISPPFGGTSFIVVLVRVSPAPSTNVATTLSAVPVGTEMEPVCPLTVSVSVGAGAGAVTLTVIDMEGFPNDAGIVPFEPKG
jgi:hypothetical protein